MWEEGASKRKKCKALARKYKIERKGVKVSMEELDHYLISKIAKMVR